MRHAFCQLKPLVPSARDVLTRARTLRGLIDPRALQWKLRKINSIWSPNSRMLTTGQGGNVNSYDEKMAPLFAQILLQREFAQHEILRQVNDRFETDGAAPRPSPREHARFGRAAEELKALWSARRRITDKSYGSCVSCGEPIDLQRLNTLPTVACCYACGNKGST
jgi:DnaK suppressor protein